MELARFVPGYSSKEDVDEVVAAVRAELVRIVTADIDPNTNEEDVQVHTEKKDGLIWIIGKIVPENDYIDIYGDPDSPTKTTTHTLIDNQESDR